MSNMIHSQYLTVLGTEDEVSSYTVLTNSTVSTNPVDVRRNNGYSSLLITTTTDSTVTVKYQISENGVNFYDPVDTNLTSLGGILSSVTTAAASVTRWIVFSPQVARSMRFSILGNSSYSTVTVKYIHQED